MEHILNILSVISGVCKHFAKTCRFLCLSQEFIFDVLEIFLLSDLFPII